MFASSPKCVIYLVVLVVSLQLASAEFHCMKKCNTCCGIVYGYKKSVELSTDNHCVCEVDKNKIRPDEQAHDNNPEGFQTYPMNLKMCDHLCQDKRNINKIHHHSWFALKF